MTWDILIYGHHHLGLSMLTHRLSFYKVVPQTVAKLINITPTTWFIILITHNIVWLQYSYIGMVHRRTYWILCWGCWYHSCHLQRSHYIPNAWPLGLVVVVDVAESFCRTLPSYTALHLLHPELTSGIVYNSFEFNGMDGARTISSRLNASCTSWSNSW